MKTDISVKSFFPVQKRGSITLEAAVFFPVVLFVFVCLLSKINGLSSEFTLYEIIDETSQKASIRNIFVGYLNDLIGQESTDVYEYDAATASELADLTSLSMLVLTCRNEIREESDKSGVFGKTIRIKNVYTEENITNGLIHIICDYAVKTPLGEKHGSYIVPVPLWESQRTYPAANTESEDTDIWTKDNFERGIFFRKRFGGNLPLGYPVISGFSAGSVLSIRSIDLNKKTWDDPNDVFNELKKEIDDLANFKGTPQPWGSDRIVISEKDITSRIMKIIVPGKYDKEKFSGVTGEIRSYCKEISVQIIFIEYG